ncbi:hypothetical protein [Paracoccus homiensis]|uniref:Helix-turn-helix domain-containing protein n=1 Tax=Paracoccus homiensis TaxID=364199 RepID=A0A1I0GXX3_9RHOB|nr:hypothetical protein [Paracoccus homiensis]SET76110.1 hypothetical protein SAMN04489858_109142 [Paracoccus homiensis]
MGRPDIQPMFASANTAARMLDMKPAEFRSLVESGALPGPVRHQRWDVEQIRAIMRGEFVRPSEEFDL